MPADRASRPKSTIAGLVVGEVYAGDHAEARVLRPLCELATPLADVAQPMPFTVVQSAFDGFFPRGYTRAYWKATYVATLDDEVIEIVASASAERPSPLSVVDTYAMGGAIARVGAEETAFPERSAPFMVTVQGNWTDAGDDDANIAGVRGVWEEVDALGVGSTYLNFSGSHDAEPARAAVGFGLNLERLARIKAQIDPGERVSPQQQHRPLGAADRPAREQGPCSCGLRDGR